MNNKTVMITGVQGYIGSHIAKAFKSVGWAVTGLDIVEEKSHIKPYVDKFMKIDYTNHIMTEAYIKNVMPAVIVHCGGTSLVGPSMKDPDTYYRNNVAGTVSFLDSIMKAYVGLEMPTILFSSSAGVYGNPKTSPIQESKQTKPMSPYGQTKLIIEHMLHDYYEAHRLPSVSFRFFNAAGASTGLGQDPGATHIIARIMESKINGDTFTLFGTDYNTPDGTCIRDYVHVKDIAQAHVMAVTEHSVQGAEVYNLGTAEGYSNQQIIDECIAHCGEFEYNKGERRLGDPDRLIANASKIKKAFGWEPKHSDLKTIIKDAWNWYNK